jgi:hypothetical protein
VTQELNEIQLTNPLVKRAIITMNSGNRSDWFAIFTYDATLTDDGETKNLMQWSDSEIFFTGQARVISIDREENHGLTLYGNLHSAQWGEFKTYFQISSTWGQVFRGFFRKSFKIIRMLSRQMHRLLLVMLSIFVLGLFPSLVLTSHAATAVSYAGYLGHVSPGQEATYVTAEWNVSPVTCNAALHQGQDLDILIGLSDAKTIEDVATYSYCPSGSSAPVYHAYAYLNPGGKTIILPLTISAGDEVQGSVTVNPATHSVTMKLTDLKTHKSSSYTKVNGKTAPVEVYWLIGNNNEALPKFSKAIKFQDASAIVSGKTLTISQFPFLLKDTMTDGSGKILAKASAISGGGKVFSVTWKGYT